MRPIDQLRERILLLTELDMTAIAVRKTIESAIKVFRFFTFFFIRYIQIN